MTLQKDLDRYAAPGSWTETHLKEDLSLKDQLAAVIPQFETILERQGASDRFEDFKDQKVALKVVACLVVVHDTVVDKGVKTSRIEVFAGMRPESVKRVNESGAIVEKGLSPDEGPGQYMQFPMGGIKKQEIGTSGNIDLGQALRREYGEELGGLPGSIRAERISLPPYVDRATNKLVYPVVLLAKEPAGPGQFDSRSVFLQQIEEAEIKIKEAKMKRPELDIAPGSHFQTLEQIAHSALQNPDLYHPGFIYSVMQFARAVQKSDIDLPSF